MINTQNIQSSSPENGQLLSIHSGKSGVGKTHFALNLSLALVQKANRVLLIDGNFLSGDVHHYLGEIPKQSLTDVILQGIPLEDVILPHTSGLDIVYGISSLEDLKSSNTLYPEKLFESINNLKSEYNYILIDHAAGLSEFIQTAAFLSDQCIVMTTPESASVNDSYAFIKVLSNMHPSMKFRTVINEVKSQKEADEIFERFYLVVEHFLKSDLKKTGYLVEDKQVRIAVQKQTPFILQAPQSKVSKCVMDISDQIQG